MERRALRGARSSPFSSMLLHVIHALHAMRAVLKPQKLLCYVQTSRPRGKLVVMRFLPVVMALLTTTILIILILFYIVHCTSTSCVDVIPQFGVRSSVDVIPHFVMN
ncbi:unnamed protein product [Amoebophrya sp. A25]|nr:unnamed protein product [Amoebophrya sp. A25]|eukprot:GSA25T00021950001.1